MDINKIIENKDKEIVFKSLVQDDFNHSECGVVDIDTYKEKFKERNGFSLDQIKERIIEKNIESITQNEVNVIFDIAKSFKPAETPAKDDNSKNYQYIVKSASKGIVTGIVLEPGDENQRDLQGQFLNEEEIEKAMYVFMTNHQNLGLQHQSILKSGKDSNRQAVLIENYIAPQDITIGTETVKKGSWIQTWQTFGEVKEMIDKGLKTGFSIGGTGIVTPC